MVGEGRPYLERQGWLRDLREASSKPRGGDGEEASCRGNGVCKGPVVGLCGASSRTRGGGAGGGEAGKMSVGGAGGGARAETT